MNNTALHWGTRDDDEIVLGQMFTILLTSRLNFYCKIDLYFSTQMINVKVLTDKKSFDTRSNQWWSEYSATLVLSHLCTSQNK